MPDLVYGVYFKASVQGSLERCPRCASAWCKSTALRALGDLQGQTSQAFGEEFHFVDTSRCGDTLPGRFWIILNGRKVQLALFALFALGTVMHVDAGYEKRFGIVRVDFMTQALGGRQNKPKDV